MALVDERRPVFDLSGPDGNALVLLGATRNLGRQLGWTPQTITEVTDEMQSKDYTHIVRQFNKHFGELVDIVLPPSMSKEDILGSDASASSPTDAVPAKRSSTRRRA